MNFHLCFSIPINVRFGKDTETKGHSEKSMNVSDVMVTDEESKEHHHEGANLDQSCRSARLSQM